MATDNWPDTAPVTRSCSSWASSTTTTSYSGSTARPFEGADGQHGVVGHHDVGLACAGPCQLAEALLGEGALLRAEALHGRHGDLPPSTVRDPGHKFVTVAGSGLFGPFAKPDHFLAQL